jgi:hypothetical protein
MHKCIWHTCRTFKGSKYIYAKYVLDPYATSSYCIYYLIKINKFITQKMKIILNKHKQK